MKTLKLLLFSLFLLVSSVFAREVGVAWDQNPIEPNVAPVTQYRIYKLDNGVRTLLATANGMTTTTATINAETGWTIAMTAYNGSLTTFEPLRESLLSSSIMIPVGPAPPTIYTVVSVSNQEIVYSDRQIAFAFDGDTNTYWATTSDGMPPYEMILDFGKEYDVGGINYQAASIAGAVGQFEIYVTNDLTNWGAVAGSGEFANTLTPKTFTMTKKAGRYGKFKILTAASGGNYVNMAELTFILTDPPVAPSKPTGLKVEFVK